MGDVATKDNGPNWDRIEADYKRGMPRKEIIKKHGITSSALNSRISRGKWKVGKSAVARKKREKCEEKIADIQANTAARLLKMQSEAALVIYGNLLETAKSFPNGVGTKNVRETVEVKKLTINGEEREFPLHKTFTNDLEAVVRSMTALARLYGIDAASQISRERFDLQKQQGGGADDTDAFNENILSIAELINHPLPDRTMEQVEAPAPETEPKDGDGT